MARVDFDTCVKCVEQHDKDLAEMWQKHLLICSVGTIAEIFASNEKYDALLRNAPGKTFGYCTNTLSANNCSACGFIEPVNLRNLLMT